MAISTGMFDRLKKQVESQTLGTGYIHLGTGYIHPKTVQMHVLEDYTDWRRVQSTSDLDHAVFKTPVATLVNLWVARFGDGWVDKKGVQGDEFFEWVAVRLKQMGKLEEHLILEKQQVVVRVVDDAPKN